MGVVILGITWKVKLNQASPSRPIKQIVGEWLPSLCIWEMLLYFFLGRRFPGWGLANMSGMFSHVCRGYVTSFTFVFSSSLLAPAVGTFENLIDLQCFTLTMNQISVKGAVRMLRGGKRAVLDLELEEAPPLIPQEGKEVLDMDEIRQEISAKGVVVHPLRPPLTNSALRVLTSGVQAELKLDKGKNGT